MTTCAIHGTNDTCSKCVEYNTEVYQDQIKDLQAQLKSAKKTIKNLGGALYKERLINLGGGPDNIERIER